MMNYCTCTYPIIRGTSPEYCGNCGKNIEPLPDPKEVLRQILNRFGCQLMTAQATGACKKHSNAIADFVDKYIEENRL